MENQNVNVIDNDDKNTDKNNPQPMYTQADVDSMISKLYDRWDKQAKKKAQQQASLMGLDENQRTIAEKDIELQELRDTVAKYEALKVKQDKIDILTKRGLSYEFADYIPTKDNEEDTLKAIDVFDKLFKKAVEDEVKKRLNSTTTKVSNNGAGGITKEQFKKMSLVEKQRLYTSNPDLYRELVGRQ